MKKIKLKKTVSGFQNNSELPGTNTETRWQPHHSFECSKKIKIRKVDVSYVLSLEEINSNFYEPIMQLIENNGCNDDGVIIVDVNGAAVIAEILESIMGIKPKLNIVEIFEKNIIESECEQNCENTIQDSEVQGSIDDDDDDDDDDGDEDKADSNGDPDPLVSDVEGENTLNIDFETDDFGVEAANLDDIYL